MPNDSGTDLAQLEYEFATSPNSEAFIPLAEEYLKRGRFVEAMVVCKKGIKAHPELPTGRLIMARIYSDQAKHQKAIDELNSLLKLSPQNTDAFRLLGTIHLKLGKTEEGVDYLKKTLDANPGDQEARDELLKRGIDYQPASAAPPPEPEPAPPAVSGQVPMSERPTQRELDPVPPGTSSDQIPARRTGQQPVARQPVAQRPTQGAPRRQAPPRKRIADIFQEMEQEQAKPKRTGIKVTLAMAGVLLVGLVIYVIYTWQAGLKQQEINENLEQGRIRFNSDTYNGYVQALENYSTIYKLDKEHPEALSRGAFIGAVLTGEFSAERKYLDQGDKFMREAMAIGQTSTMHTAAQALLMVYAGGSANDAIKLLDKAFKEQPESAILHTTAGLILLNKGDLGEAKEHLLKGAAQNETRALVGLGEYAMRRSLYREATQFFNRGLQSDNGHIRSLLGLATVSVVRGTEGAYQDLAEKKLKDLEGDLSKEASEKEKKQAKFLGLVLKARDRSKRKATLEEIDKVLKAESSNALFHFIMAREYRRLGERLRGAAATKRLTQGKELIAKALRMDSSRPDFVLEEAAIYLALADYEAARARALRVQRMDAEGGQSMLLAGDAYLGEKNWAKAREYYEKARDFDDSEAISHYKLARLFLTMPRPDPDQAQAELELAVQSLAGVGERRLAAESSTMLAQIYANKNRTEEFVAIIEKAVAIDPSYAPPHALIAANLNLESAEGKEAAREHCTKYLELAPRGEYVPSCKELLKKTR